MTAPLRLQAAPRATGTTTQGMTYDRAERRLSTEASTLLWYPYWIPGRGVLDEITVVSHVTGKSMIFDYVKTHRSSEGEITSWEYRGEDLTLTIFND